MEPKAISDVRDLIRLAQGEVAELSEAASDADLSQVDSWPTKLNGLATAWQYLDQAEAVLRREYIRGLSSPTTGDGTQ